MLVCVTVQSMLRSVGVTEIEIHGMYIHVPVSLQTSMSISVYMYMGKKKFEPSGIIMYVHPKVH